MIAVTGSPFGSHAEQPSPAATVILLRDGAGGPQVFMVRRHEGTAFMAGADVFPGGRVDAGDRAAADDRWCEGIDQAAAQLGDLPPAEAVAYHVAAVRETFEEAGILLARDSDGEFARLDGGEVHARFTRHRRDVHAGIRSLSEVMEAEDLRLALGSLVPFAHWLTPPIDVRRFDTRFFVTRVPPDQTPAHDNTETTHSTWVTPADAIARCRRGEIVLPPPTWTTLRELEAFTDVTDAVTSARARHIARREPEYLVDGERKLLVLPGDPLSSEPSAEPSLGETRFEFANGRWLAREKAT
jgi:8-oxo-dGTP pyrophosphatase MutT (NUDIX family)